MAQRSVAKTSKRERIAVNPAPWKTPGDGTQAGGGRQEKSLENHENPHELPLFSGVRLIYTRGMATHDRSRDAGEWLAGSLGQYLLAREQAFFDRVVADVFGYNAFQLGMPEVDLLQASRIPMRCRVGRDDAAGLRADFQDLPIAGNSADLVLLPHTLEFTDYPHQILREVARVLRPEGQVIIASFNPWSLWGARRVFGRRQRYPWSGRFINLMRMKDWLALLGLDIAGGRWRATYRRARRRSGWTASRSWKRRATAGGRSRAGSTSSRPSSASTGCASSPRRGASAWCRPRASPPRPRRCGSPMTLSLPG
jgi:SAM-dependent methyltransferase